MYVCSAVTKKCILHNSPHTDFRLWESGSYGLASKPTFLSYPYKGTAGLIENISHNSFIFLFE